MKMINTGERDKLFKLKEELMIKLFKNKFRQEIENLLRDAVGSVLDILLFLCFFLPSVDLSLNCSLSCKLSTFDSY